MVVDLAQPLTGLKMQSFGLKAITCELVVGVMAMLFVIMYFIYVSELVYHNKLCPK